MAKKISLNKGKRGLVESRNKPLRIPNSSAQSKYFTSKDLVLQKKVLAALKNHVRGITASQLAKELDLYHQSVMNVLETLVALREAYDLKYGGIKVFYPNGKLNHPVRFQDMHFDGKMYSFSEIIQHITGQKYVFIQEKEPDQHDIYEPKGGILLREEDLDLFIQRLAQFKDELQLRRHAGILPGGED